MPEYLIVFITGVLVGFSAFLVVWSIFSKRVRA